jgi:hypothetical protein
MTTSKIVGTQSLLLNYKGTEVPNQGRTQSSKDGVLFAHQTLTKPKPTGDGKTHAGIICRDCNEAGPFQGNSQCALQKKLKEDAEKNQHRPALPRRCY